EARPGPHRGPAQESARPRSGAPRGRRADEIESPSRRVMLLIYRATASSSAAPPRAARGAVARLVPRKKVTERDVAVSKPPVGNVVVSKIMTYNVGHVTADPEIQLLNRLGGLFSASLSLNENIEAMLRATSQMVQFDAATVFLLNEGSRELTATATYPHRDMAPHIARPLLAHGILGYAVDPLETLK